MAYKVDFSKSLWDTETFDNPYDKYTSFEKDEHYKNLVEMLKKENEAKSVLNTDPSRSTLDRVFDLISTPLYVTAGAVKGAIDPNSTVLGGIGGGLRAGLNFFGDEYQKGETTYSDVLESAGWKPESTLGKVAKGTLGFIGDVLLDPLSYLSGGMSAAVRGTGRAAFNATRDVEKLGAGLGRSMADDALQGLTGLINKGEMGVEDAVKVTNELADDVAKEFAGF